MVDYTTWKITNEIPVTEVKLDRLNPRIPENSESLTQEDILNLMVEDYKITELAESIAAKGFMPLDNMVITYEDDIPVVLEGNRRVAALKLLINPAMAPIKERRKYETLSAQIDVKMIMNPNFAVAPNREAASPLILDRHTVATEIPWSSIMQAEFHRDVLRKRGLELPTKEVLEEYHLKEKEMTESLLRLDIYERAYSFTYPSATIDRKVKDKLNFEITTLERLVNPSISQKLFKYRISNGKLTVLDESFFNAFLKSVVIHMYEPIEGLQRITSRSANKINQIEKYLRAIRREITTTIPFDEAPNDQEGRSAEKLEDNIDKVSILADKGDVESPQNNPVPSRSTRKMPKRRTIHSNELRFGYYSPPNQRIYDELGKIPVKEAPSCVTITIRVLFERTIRAYLKKMGIKKIPRLEGGKARRISITEADFGEILDWIIKEDANVVLDSEIRKALKKFKYGSNTELLSLSRLNAVIHEPLQVIDKDEVFAIWDNLALIIAYFMNSPETNVEGMATKD